jgi:hypothetical protein
MRHTFPETLTACGLVFEATCPPIWYHSHAGDRLYRQGDLHLRCRWSGRNGGEVAWLASVRFKQNVSVFGSEATSAEAALADAERVAHDLVAREERRVSEAKENLHKANLMLALLTSRDANAKARDRLTKPEASSPPSNPPPACPRST